MPSKHPQETEDLHFRVLTLLEDQPDLSQRGLAEKWGVRNGKLHHGLNALIHRSLVKLGNLATFRRHLGKAYLLTPAGIAQKAGMTHRFLKRKMAEYEALRMEIGVLEADLSGVAEARGPKRGAGQLLAKR